MPQFTAETAVTLHRPEYWTSPLVLSSPHSGRHYPARFLDQSPLDPLSLRRSEDAWVDRLFDFAPVNMGAPLLSARFPRSYTDVNREEREIDPAMFIPRPENVPFPLPPRVKAGLGMIARVISADMPIYDRHLPLREYVDRRDSCYRPWHRQLNNLLDEGSQRFGGILLVDCHSMPSSVETGAGFHGQMDIVLGDRYGAACHPAISDLFEKHLRDQGLVVRRNQPYAGGYITSNYGRPLAGRHAIQIEINRRLYLDQDKVEIHDGFHQLQDAMKAAFTRILEEFDRSWLLAREEPDWQMADCAE